MFREQNAARKISDWRMTCGSYRIAAEANSLDKILFASVWEGLESTGIEAALCGACVIGSATAGGPSKLLLLVRVTPLAAFVGYRSVSCNDASHSEIVWCNIVGWRCRGTRMPVGLSEIHIGWPVDMQGIPNRYKEPSTAEEFPTSWRLYWKLWFSGNRWQER